MIRLHPLRLNGRLIVPRPLRYRPVDLGYRKHYRTHRKISRSKLPNGSNPSAILRLKAFLTEGRA